MTEKNYGVRPDGTPKGRGYFGELPRTDDPSMISTELSEDMELDGQTILYPLIVPTLTRDELAVLLAGQPPTDAIRQKAQAHAIERLKLGRNPFADEEDGFQEGAEAVLKPK